MFLAGDVGGTKTLLGLFKRERGKLRSVREDRFPSRDFPSLEAIVREFLDAGREKVDAFAVGVAGPVVNGRSQVVNLRWPVDASRLEKRLEVGPVRVLNDLEATGWGIGELPPHRWVSLTPGLRGTTGNAALIAAGTGLGMALLFWDGERHVPSASEGGHQEFGPRSDLEIDLLRFMRERHGRVSTERLVAGPGVSAIHDFLADSGRARSSDAIERKLAAADDRNAAIVQAALADEDEACQETLNLFVSLYGSAAGDLALVSRSTAGVWVGGGIAPKILSRLRQGDFVRSFRNKGRLTPLLEKIPVKVILEPRTALLGAAACAARLRADGRARSRKTSRRSRA